MRVVIDGRLYGLEHSGIGRYLVHLIKELQQLDNKNDYSVLLRKKYYLSLKLANNWTKVLVDFRHYTLAEQIVVPFILSKIKPDLLHVPQLNPPFFWFGNTILTVHDLTMQHQGRDASNLPLIAYYLKRMPFLFNAQVALKRARKILTPTKAVKSEVCDYYRISKNKVTSAYLGVDFRKVVSSGLKSPARSPYFFYVGNAYPHKNLARLIQAVVLLNSKIEKKVKLVIAGSKNEFTQRLVKLVKGLDAQKYVQLLGFVSDADLQAYYKNSVAFVYPSLSEGFGLQGLEAMASGGLVLASDIPVFREVYGKQAYYFDPKDIDSIAYTLGVTLDMPKKDRQKVISSYAAHLTKFSWRKMAQKTLAAYREAVD